MAIKMGKTMEEIRAMREQNDSFLTSNIMDRYDVVSMTDKYADKIASIDKAVLEPEKDQAKAEAKILNFVESEKDKVVKIPLEKLSPSPKNVFNPMEGEKRDEFISSLRTFGQINPIIVRPKACVEAYQEQIENEFEILVGHTRYAGLKEIGIETADAIIVECDDVEATLFIAQSNIQREKVSELEVAMSYKNTYEAMKQRKGGNDKVLKGQHFSEVKQSEIENAESLENADVSPKCQTDTQRRTDEIVAASYGISARTLHRKMALAYCTDDVINLYTKKKLTQQQIEYISRASVLAQTAMVEVMKKEKLAMTDEIAKGIWKASDKELEDPSLKNEFPLNTMREIMRRGQPDNSDELKAKAKKKNDKVQRLKVKEGLYRISNSVFPKEIKSVEDREAWLVEAAAMYVQYQDEYSMTD